jgi:hypothetical protein
LVIFVIRIVFFVFVNTLLGVVFFPLRVITAIPWVVFLRVVKALLGLVILISVKLSVLGLLLCFRDVCLSLWSYRLGRARGPVVDDGCNVWQFLVRWGQYLPGDR